jgi:hypothetical protein
MVGKILPITADRTCTRPFVNRKDATARVSISADPGCVVLTEGRGG